MHKETGSERGNRGRGRGLGLCCEKEMGERGGEERRVRRERGGKGRKGGEVGKERSGREGGGIENLGSRG